MRILRILVWCLVLWALYNSEAKADWVCETQASVSMDPTTVLSCGIGTSTKESEARELAYENAMREFYMTCSDSSECQHSQINAKPKRTSCYKNEDVFTCYRAVEVEILKSKAIRNIASKFEKPNPSYLNLGLGFNLDVHDQYIKAGPSVNLKYCIVDLVCPLIEIATGQLLDKRNDVLGSYKNGTSGIQLYLVKRFYVSGGVGYDYTLFRNNKEEGRFYKTNLGVDTIRVGDTSISFDSGLKYYKDGKVIPSVNFHLNFKF